jgi:hypothetical protein
MSDDKMKEIKKQIIQMFRGERGRDFLKCFKDMSVKDASRVCQIPLATLKKIRHEMRDTEWNFNKLKAGYQMNQWQEIRKFREEMMKDEAFAPFQDLLRHAAKYGAAMQKICVPKASEIEAMSLFEKGAHEAAESKKNIQRPPVAASAPIPATFSYPPPNSRNWSVFTSLNEHERVYAWHLRQQRLAALTREAMQIVTSLPPPVQITAPAPRDFVPLPVMLPPRKDSEKPQGCEAGTQACANTALEAMKDKSLWRDATPREINAGPPKPLPYYEGTVAKEAQLRSWMLLQSMVFDDSSRYIRSLEVRWLAQRASKFTRTPECALDLEARRFAFLAPENMQLDPELAVLPDLEPITDWGWLLTTGLAPQAAA